MKIVIFGLTISSSWGNGHATLWRGLVRALSDLGCTIVFYERELAYYTANRDLTDVRGAKLALYENWEHVRAAARQDIADCDVAIVSSYCPDALAASDLVNAAPAALSVFYDLDTPVTLSRMTGGEDVGYIGPRGLRDFDLVLSFTGGLALDHLRDRLGARRAVPLYGHVDPSLHRPTQRRPHYDADLSYLGTYALDRQAALQSLFVDAARSRPEARFLIGGAQYPMEFPWNSNIYFVRHLPPDEHPAFFSSSRLTLNITREPMRRMGWCPSGRLFEAAACGTAIISDDWEGLDAFYTKGSEILIARTTADVTAALDLSDAEIGRIAKDARERTLAEHTSAHRAAELLRSLQAAGASHSVAEPTMQGA
jgi:spore maturation protein CgeB